MKFSCDKKTLLDAILPASLAVSNKSTIPSLEGLLFDAEDGVLTVTGYDLEKAIRCTVDANVSENGKVVIKSSRILSIARSLPDDTVCFETDDRFVAHITCGSSVFEIHAGSGDSYPILPEIDDSSCLKIPQSQLRKMLSQTQFAIGVNDPKPTLNGALFEIQSDTLRIVTLDGDRLAYRCSYAVVQDNENPMKFIVPGKTLSELNKLLSDVDEPVAIEVSRKVIIFSIDNIVFISRLIEGEFYDYKKSFEQVINTTVNVNREELTEVVERCMLVVDEKNKSPIRLKFENGVLKASCISGNGKVFDEIPVDIEGDAIEIGFNGKYVLDVLHILTEDTIKLNLSSPVKSMLILPPGDYDKGEGDYVYLVLPIKLKAVSAD